MSTMKAIRIKTAAQDVWVEVWKDDVRLHYYVVRAGERVDLYNEDGFRTEVEPHLLKLDAAVAGNPSDTIPEERREEAVFRLERASADEAEVEKVYGPFFSD
jgi:hypothetical protein